MAEYINVNRPAAIPDYLRDPWHASACSKTGQSPCKMLDKHR
nr:hypothetical protein [Candidatus Sigynarchaeum springense]